ncbi:thiol:disulfide interchange protein DsbA/DsbL [Massilia sp. W12]|uniref:thiol:disulfide interchange protein DsbA/DsbL n=1 Tax=Massilia sp. W12 TaxID=3126507 RepID=UPI0030D1779F
MRILQKFWQFVGITLLALGASQLQAQANEGYTTLQNPLPTESGKKVEVIEFFWYGCPHCNDFDPYLEDWVKKQGDKIAFKRIPANFRESFVPQQKTYYALEAMGKLEQYHSKIFAAIHKERQKLDTEAQLTDFLVKNGIDKAKFQEAFNSFSVQTKARRASGLQGDYRIDGVPTIVINGRYITSPSKMGEVMGRVPEPALFQATLKLMSQLVDKSAAK